MDAEAVLKPCPFCRSTDISSDGHARPVYCKKCWARAVDLAAWNTRPTVEATAGVEIKPTGEPCRLDECPPGLFLFNGSLGFRSEYWTSGIKPDAYCLDSGEYFWGGARESTMARAALIVQPVELVPLSQPQGETVDLAGQLNSCPDLNHARIVAPGQRVPEVVVPMALRDQAAAALTAKDAEIEALRERVRELEAGKSADAKGGES